MDKMSNELPTFGHGGRVREFSAADAKNQFGLVLETAIAGDTVAITKYGEVTAVVISVDRYQALSQDPVRTLNLLTEHFDAMLAAMQGDGVREAMQAAFRASPEELGRAAVEVARAKRASRTLG